MLRRFRSRDSAPRARDLALVICAAWLLLQNSLLLIWVSSPHLEPAFVVARALIKVGAHLFAQLWMLPAAMVLGAALALSNGESHDAARKRREVSHA
ncbi:MAG TPA: hypothetical protein VMJ70_07055 [Candidatus Sulfotelmatobacter sp.]|nr:hypothetical protein [Candidatus Sulfotelmatobacter sp.]